MPIPHPLPANNLLTALPRKDRQRFLAGCESVELTFAEVLAKPGELIRHVYFPTQSFITVTTQIDEHPSVEVGLVGDEGMLGVTLLLGIETAPLHALVQGSGHALRMTAERFRREVNSSAALHHALQRYLYVVLSQLAQTIACTRFHVVEARLARWLLMTQDRAHADSFHMTHAFLAHILGVRRVGITKAATALQRRKLISYHRGNITVLDREGLLNAACVCYAADKAIYARTIDWTRSFTPQNPIDNLNALAYAQAGV